ncbi:MAG: PKD domain-containing protein [Hymenobacteraceae bacterium]|nr:PKD domain-containing protein [Hymenobacteraceae bacterium]MDX5394915.1 PKD domain-containing protein [Hymenobacteraceae bacterium]MDX5510950.1 PKD domain-containing protein [Hymenobacteraceae bacterium]
MKVTRLLFYSFVAGVLSASQLQAQNRQHWCATDEYNAEMRAKNPNIYKQRDKIEQQILHATQQGTNQNQKTNAALKVIPVVVHVVTENGLGGISDAQVEDGIRILNEDFRRRNADTTGTRAIFKGVAADAEVEFRLARIDPQGNCTNGITRDASVYTNGTQFSNRDAVKLAVPAWPTDKYFNVWIVENIYSPVPGNIILGFAQFPTPVLGPTYGIVVRHDEWGGIGTSQSGGRTVTHEVGHCLNLYHTFQGSCGNDCSNSGDFVCDTPPANAATYGCNTSLNTCSNDMVGPSPYISNVNDQLENYMSYDACQNMFTQGQKVRIDQSFLQYPQLQNLVSPANLVATGTNDGFAGGMCPPVASFVPASNSVCAGSSLNFTSNSHNAPNPASFTYSWNFPGGSPAAATGATATTTYNNPGNYTVSLTASNSAGSDIETKTDVIRVVSVSSGEKAPFTESFEDPSFPNHPTDPFKNWITDVSLPNTTRWERTTNASTAGNSSIRLRNNVNTESAISTIVSPSYDFSNIIGSGLLSFDLAFAQRSTTNNDQLKLYVSTNCGQTWQIRKTISGSSLSTTGSPVATTFTPNNSQWRTELLNLNQYSRQPSVMFKIEFISGGGNIVYIDNFRLSGTVGVKDDVNAAKIMVHPNPVTEETVIELELSKSENIRMELFDAVGKLVYSEAERNYGAGTYIFNLQQKVGKLNSGVYLLKILSEDRAYSTKLITN